MVIYVAITITLGPLHCLPLPSPSINTCTGWLCLPLQFLTVNMALTFITLYPYHSLSDMGNAHCDDDAFVRYLQNDTMLKLDIYIYKASKNRIKAKMNHVVICALPSRVHVW